MFDARLAVTERVGSFQPRVCLAALVISILSKEECDINGASEENIFWARFYCSKYFSQTHELLSSPSAFSASIHSRNRVFRLSYRFGIYSARFSFTYRGRFSISPFTLLRPKTPLKL